MMTLVALAITVAYAYSAVVVLGLPGTVFFWETATLIDIMLLGHWIEMRSVLGASRALEQLVRLLPAVAHRVRSDGSVEDMPLDALRSGDRGAHQAGRDSTDRWPRRAGAHQRQPSDADRRVSAGGEGRRGRPNRRRSERRGRDHD